MRLLLDAHVSGPNVGRRLEAAHHDVRALDQEFPASSASQYEFDLVTRGIQAWLLRRSNQDDWRDYPAVLDRDLAGRSGIHLS